MRPPSRIALPIVSAAFFALSAASLASADTASAPTSIDEARFHSITKSAFDKAYDSVSSRVDERLSIALSGPTTMECEKSVESGLETCVVRSVGGVASTPAALAHN